jgi:hypothetical protein
MKETEEERLKTIATEEAYARAKAVKNAAREAQIAAYTANFNARIAAAKAAGRASAGIDNVGIDPVAFAAAAKASHIDAKAKYAKTQVDLAAARAAHADADKAYRAAKASRRGLWWRFFKRHG